MKGYLLILFVICASVNSMVPRDRRSLQSSVEENTDSTTICALTTPCGWSMYDVKTKIINMNITNSYCRCGSGYRCTMEESDSPINGFEHYCQSVASS